MKKIYKLLSVVLFCIFSCICFVGCKPKIIEAKNVNHLTNPTITDFVYLEDKWQLNTFVNIDFNKIEWDNIKEIKFFLYYGTRLVGTAVSKGENLDNLLMQIPDSGVQVISCNFYKIDKKKENDGLWIRSYCTMEYPESATYLKVTVQEQKDTQILRYTTSNNKFKNYS